MQKFQQATQASIPPLAHSISLLSAHDGPLNEPCMHACLHLRHALIFGRVCLNGKLMLAVQGIVPLLAKTSHCALGEEK